ncbi:hypothetical protein C1H46_034128 [Malus baccata]|uniref:Uncharacterized protein n=1 Tax=Malus baccata TaxID=106549 RepID=A0A540L1K3_MALBA|nr:hypothetical protein C1H46_034128 [Malus baccata]
MEPMLVYFDYLRSFRVEFDEFFEEGIISEIEVGLGPCGELQILLILNNMVGNILVLVNSSEKLKILDWGEDS